jgi:stearoyl-CoA desaturase (Delta-9 desaturase)
VPLNNVVAAFVAAFVVTQLAIFATTVYLHRALSHRALTVRGPAAVPFRVVIWMTTGMRPREWVAVHRKHHAATDTPDDPHSPAQVGFWRVQLGNVGLYKRCAADRANVQKYARDLPADTLDRVALDYSLVGLGVGTSILVLTMWALGFGLLTGLLAAGIHAVMYVMLSGAINAAGHTFGRHPYENSATNLQWLALITAGEGLHNNHHAAPTSARFALRKGEIDPGWWLVRVLVGVHLARVRHDDVHLKTAA